MNTRRHFIKQTGAVVAGAWLLPSLVTKRSTKNIGIQLWTVRDVIDKDVKGTIRQIAEDGYKDVEIFFYSSDHKLWGLSGNEFKKLLDATGLKSSSGHYIFGKYFNNGNLDEVHLSIDIAHALDNEYITIPSINDKFKNTLDACKATAEKFNKLGEFCKKEGLKLAYHNHNIEFKQFGDTYGYEVFLKETDPALVNFEMDIYWLINAGKDPVALFNQFPGRFPMWHVKDMDKNNREENTEVGKGSIDFKTIFASAKKSGLKHFYVEQESNYQPDIMGAAKADYDYIKRELI
ncbi:MAG: sugar phosphate isomerase/epimerase [Arachidicoccus sp.]|nr:sugar phosphate isomerase/epimerase [Arachidicoccus sp.]